MIMSQFVRRCLSLFLTLTLVAGMLPMGVFATETTEPTQETEATETVQTTAPEETTGAAEEETVPEEETTSPPEEIVPEEEVAPFALDEDEMSEEDFAKAVQAAADTGDSYDLTRNVTLTAATAGLIIQNFVHVQHGYTLTLAEGSAVYIQNEGQLVAEGGTIDVQSGAKLIVAQDSFLQVWMNGTLNVDANATFSANPGLIVVNVQENTTVTGVSENMFTAVFHPQTGADIENAYKTYGDPYARVAVYLWDNVTLAQDITIPGNCSFYIQAASGHSLTVPGDYTLTNYGNIFLEANSDNRIVVEKGATFTNSGFVTINTPAIFSVLGTYNNYGTVGGTGSISTAPAAYVTALPLHWDSQAGTWIVDSTMSPTKNQASNFTAWNDHYLVFYLNTYDSGEETWKATAIVPDGMDTDYISIETLDALGANAGVTHSDSDCFVRLRTKGTLDYKKTTLFYGETQWDVELWQRQVGLYRAGSASTDNALYGDYEIAADSENAFYLLPLSDRYSISNVSITVSAVDSSYTGSGFTQEVFSDGYKITISPDFVAHCQESWNKLQFSITCTVYDSTQETSNNWQLNLEAMPVGGSTEEDEMSPEEIALREAIANYAGREDWYFLDHEVTLTQDLTINCHFIPTEGGRLIVPSGVTLTITQDGGDGHVISQGGEILLQSGSKLVLDDSLLQIWQGKLTVEDGVNLDEAYPGNIWKYVMGDSTVIGIDQKTLTGTYHPKTVQDVVDALSYHDMYDGLFISIEQNLQLTQSFIVPENATLVVAQGAFVTLQSGCTLTNNGCVQVQDNANSTMLIVDGATFVNNGTIATYDDAHFVCQGTLTGNGTVEGVVETEYTPAPYVTARWLDWCDEGQFENTDVELSRDTASNITAGDKGIYIFYLNTWDDNTSSYQAQPIVPTSDGEYITITRLTETDQQIKADEVNKDYFVVVETRGTLSYVKTSLSYGDLTWDYQICDCWAGFFSTAEPSADTILNEGNFYLDTSREENTFYWIALNGCSFDSFSYDLNTWGQDYSDATGGQDLVTVTHPSENVYKFTISPNYVDYVHCDWRNFNLAVHATVRNREDDVQQQDRDVWINPGEMYETAALIEIWTEEDQSCYYTFFKDTALIIWGHRTGYEENGDEIWVREKATLPEGVSYDVETNTLILNNANLYGMNIFSNEEDVRLPEHKLNIRLLGNSTMENLRIADEAQVTITEDSTGNLTCTSQVEVRDAAHLTFPDYQILLSGSCNIYAYDGAISGEFAYVDGARYMSMYWLDSDEEGCLFFNEENGGGRVSQNGILATESTCYLFFLNTWNSENKTWERKPIVPTTTSPYLTIQTIRSLDEAIQDGQEYADYFVRMTASGTLGDQQAYLTYGDLTENFWIGLLNVGFYTKPEATLENLLPNQHWYDLTPENNVFYLILQDGEVNDPHITLEYGTWDETCTDASNLNFILDGEPLVAMEQLEGCKYPTYKLTVNQKYLDYTGYVYYNFELRVIANWVNQWGDPCEFNYWGLWVNPQQEYRAPDALFNINTDTYAFYDEGEEGVRIFRLTRREHDRVYMPITAEEMPQGVSYDVATNTLTLDHAELDALAFHWKDDPWTDDQGKEHQEYLMPSKTVTLKLIGRNTIYSVDCEALYLSRGANMIITGDGSLDIHTTNSFAELEEGGVTCYPAVMLSSDSTLTIAGKANVTVVNDYSTATLQEWMWGITSDGGTSGLVLKDSATLNVRMPEKRTYKCDFPGEGCGYLGIHTGADETYGLKFITIEDNATLNTDAMELNGCTYTQTGGSWNIETNPTRWDNLTHDGLFTSGATMNISGGKINITSRYYDNANFEEYWFYGIQLTGGSVMNVSGGEITIQNRFHKGFGIAVYADDQNLGGSLNVSGGTLNLRNERENGLFFNALTVDMNPEQCQFHMTGGTINADGRLTPTVFYMEDGTINLTGCTDSQLPSCLEVFTGYIRGGKIAITNAVMVNDMNFSIDGGEIEIINVEKTTGQGEYTMPLAGLQNELYLPINGGTITIQAASTAIINNGTFHQMGGEIVATGGSIGLSNCGKVLLNSGSMTLCGWHGVNQWLDTEKTDDDGNPVEPLFQTGGGTGDHVLTINADVLGILAKSGVVQLTGTSQVSINIPESEKSDSTIAGIYLYDGSQGVCPSRLVIEGAAQVTIVAELKNSVGLGGSSPIIIRGTRELAPALSIRASTWAIFFTNYAESLDLLTLEGMCFVSENSGEILSSWEHQPRVENLWVHFLLDGSEPATNVTVQQQSAVQAQLSMNGMTYYIDEENVVTCYDKATDQWIPTQLPQGVQYEYASNTLTLSNTAPLNKLYIDYLDVGSTIEEIVTKLPSQEFTIHLANEYVEIYMLQLDGDVHTTVTGSGTLRLMDSSGINGTLTISDGVTLVSDQYLSVYRRSSKYDLMPSGPISKLLISEGAALVNNGVLFVDVGDNLYLDVQGSFTQGEDGCVVVAWAERGHVTGNIPKSAQILECNVTSEEQLTEILAAPISDYRLLNVFAEKITINSSYVIPGNVRLISAFPLEVGPAALTIGATGELTVAGELTYTEDINNVLSQIVNNGKITLVEGGTLCVNGNFYGNAPINEGGTIVPQATKLTIEKPKKTTFDLYEDASVDLKITITSQGAEEEPLQRVTWKSSNEKIVDPADILDNQDGTYTVKFTGKAMGKVTLTATTIDGTQKTAKVTLTTTCLPGAKLTATLTDTAISDGLQLGESIQVTVFADKTQLAPQLVRFTSSNESIATVDENGIITGGTKTGTVKITAKLNIDGDSRSVTKSIKVVAAQKETVSLYTYDADNDLYEPVTAWSADLRDVTDGSVSKTVTLYAMVTTRNFADGTLTEPVLVTDSSSLKWVSSDTSLATVKANKNGSATVTIKSKAYGMASITATATDKQKASAAMTLTVMDYTPRLSNAKLTLNPKSSEGVALDLVESYGNQILDLTFADDSINSKLKLVQDPETRVWTVYAGENCPTKGTVKANLLAYTQESRDVDDLFEISLTVTIKSSIPSVTVKQEGKLNLTYRHVDTATDTSLEDPYLKITVKDAQIDRIVQKDGNSDITTRVRFVYFYESGTEPGYYRYDSEKQPGHNYEWAVCYLELSEDCASKINTKLSLDVYLEGYNEPVTVTQTIKTTTGKLKVTTDPTSSTLNTALSQGGDGYTLALKILENGEPLSYIGEDEIQITADKTEVTQVQLPNYRQREYVYVTLQDAVACTLTITLKDSNWVQPQTITHKVKVSTANPTTVLGSSTLTLYRTFFDIPVSTTATTSQSNVSLVDMTFTGKTDGIQLSYQDGTVTAKFADETPVKAGKYKFTATGYVENAAGEKVALKSTTLTVTVTDKDPTIPMETTTVKLNKKLAGNEYGRFDSGNTYYALNVVGNQDFGVAGLVNEDKGITLLDPGSWETSWEDTANGIRLTFCKALNCFGIKASLLSANAKKTTYTLYPVVGRYDYETKQHHYYTSTTPIKLTVQPYSSTVTVNMTSSGKLDLLQPDSSITYLATIKNALEDCDIDSYVEANPVRLRNLALLDEKGNPYDMEDTQNLPFLVSHYRMIDDSRTPYQMVDAIFLKLNPDYAPGYTANKTYKVKFGYTVCGQYMESKVLSIKVNQSTAKVSAPAVTYYQAEGETVKPVTVTLTSPAKATIGSVTVNSKTSQELLNALGQLNYSDESVLSLAGDKATLYLPIENPRALKAGKTYYLYLDVAPNSLATPKVTTLKISFKVAK